MTSPNDELLACPLHPTAALHQHVNGEKWCQVCGLPDYEFTLVNLAPEA